MQLFLALIKFRCAHASMSNIVGSPQSALHATNGDAFSICLEVWPMYPFYLLLLYTILSCILIWTSVFGETLFFRISETKSRLLEGSLEKICQNSDFFFKWAFISLKADETTSVLEHVCIKKEKMESHPNKGDHLLC